MEALPYFFNLLKNNSIINTAVTTGKLTDADLTGIDYSRNKRNEFLFRNFALSEHELFAEVTILLSNFGVLIDFVTNDTRYFDNTQYYFNVQAVARRKPPLFSDNKAFVVKGKRIGMLNLFSGTVQADVMRCELYGCKIMTSFHSKKMVNQFNRESVSTESEFLNSIQSIK
jgi:hypothetical protein